MSTNPYESPLTPDAIHDDEPATEQRVSSTGIGREIFGAAVRLAGCWLIIYGAWYLWYALTLLAIPATRREYEPIEYVVSGIGYAVVAAVLIYFAPNITRLCYASER